MINQATKNGLTIAKKPFDSAVGHQLSQPRDEFGREALELGMNGNFQPPLRSMILRAVSLQARKGAVYVRWEGASNTLPLTIGSLGHHHLHELLIVDLTVA